VSARGTRGVDRWRTRLIGARGQTLIPQEDRPAAAQEIAGLDNGGTDFRPAYPRRISETAQDIGCINYAVRRQSVFWAQVLIPRRVL